MNKKELELKSTLALINELRKRSKNKKVKIKNETWHQYNYKFGKDEKVMIFISDELEKILL